MDNRSYKKMAIMLATSFCIMYGVMFLNVDSPDHVYISLTRAYMSFLMVTPMALLMLWLMGDMYKNRKLNRLIVVSSTSVFVLALFFLRNQMFITNVQYMRAMIPHHSSAILTSKHATLSNPEVRRLSAGIIESQQREIEQMKMMINNK